MPAMPSLTIVKKFTYRDVGEEFSNRYHFSGGVPADATAWKALAAAVITAEKATQTPTTSWVRAYGHVNDDSVAAWTYDYLAAGSAVVGVPAGWSGGNPMPGDVAVWVRWQTANYTSRGKRIYLRKFFHNVWQSSSDVDKLVAAQKTALETYGAAWVTGFISNQYKICGPLGAAGSAPIASTWLTTRTL